MGRHSDSDGENEAYFILHTSYFILIYSYYDFSASNKQPTRVVLLLLRLV